MTTSDALDASNTIIISELKVVSINMWGTHLDFMSMFDRSQVKSRSIPFLHECTLGCDREERMEAVGQRIKEGNYDFILFQVKSKKTVYSGITHLR